MKNYQKVSVIYNKEFYVYYDNRVVIDVDSAFYIGIFEVWEGYNILLR